MNKYLRRFFGYNKYVKPVTEKTISIKKGSLKLEINEDNQLGIGDEIPNIQLKLINGETVSLWELCEKKPVIISFYRGIWCPNCMEELALIEECLSNFSDHQIIAISPDCTSRAKQFKKDWNDRFTFAYDEGNQIAGKFGIVMKVRKTEIKLNEEVFLELFKKVGKAAYQVPIPGTYVIGKHRIIKALFLDTDYTKRIEINELIRLSNSLTSK